MKDLKKEKKKTEKAIEKRLCDLVKRLDGLALKFFSAWFTGVPDRIILMPGGRIWFVETKATGKSVKPGSRQELVQKLLTRLGFQVRIVNSDETLEKFIAEIL